MDRLTQKSENSEMVWFIDHENNGLCLEPCEMSYSHNGKAIRKLAAYEDTGLTPEEIRVLQKYHDLHTHEDAEASKYVLGLIEADKKNKHIKTNF